MQTAVVHQDRSHQRLQNINLGTQNSSFRSQNSIQARNSIPPRKMNTTVNSIKLPIAAINDEFERFRNFLGNCSGYEDYDGSFILDKRISLKQCLWIWTVLSKYDKIKYNAILRGNSANAKFCELMCETVDGKQKPIFAKFQLGDKGDNMLIDNINGYIFNHILKNSSYAPNFMRYIDSCKTLLKRETHEDIFPLNEINPLYARDNCSKDDNYKNSVLCKLLMEQPVREARVSFHELIKGQGSLSDYIIDNKEHIFSDERFHSRLCSLFKAIKNVGEMYGFCHNDAHLGNILVNDENFVLIDYGRVIFNKIDSESFSDRVKLEIAKHYDDSYCEQDLIDDYFELLDTSSNMDPVGLREIINGVMQPNGGHDVDEKTFVSSNLYMFDVMTIVMNITKLIFKLDIPVKHEILQYIKIYKDANGNTIISIQPSDIIKSTKSNNPLVNILRPGLFWFAKTIEFFLTIVSISNVPDLMEAREKRFWKKTMRFIYLQDGILYANMDGLSMQGLIHTYFQIINIQKRYWPSLIKLIYQQKDFIIALQSHWQEIKQNVKGGSKKLKIRKEKTVRDDVSKQAIPPKKNLKMKFSQVTPRYFKGYLGKEMMGGGNDTSNTAIYDAREAGLSARNHKQSSLGRTPSTDGTSINCLPEDDNITEAIMKSILK